MPAPRRAPARLLSVLAALGVGASLAVVPSAAVAGDRAALPVTGAADVVVDEQRDRVLVAQGPGTDELVVTDLAGTPTGTVPVSDAVHVVLDEVRGWYWVSQVEQHTLTAVDADTLEVVGTFDAREGAEDGTACPATAAPVGRLVAFTSVCDYASGGEYLRLLDPDTGAVTSGGGRTEARRLLGPPASAPEGSALARSLWTFGYGYRLVRLEVDPASGAVAVAATAPGETLFADLALDPAGSTVVSARGERWDALTLQPLTPLDLPRDRYEDPFSGTDVAVGPDGRTVLVGNDVAPTEPVQVVPAGTLEPARTYDLRRGVGEGIDRWRSPEALAVGAQDTYVVSQGEDGFRLDVLSPGPDATLALGEPAAAYPYGARVRLPVQLDARSAQRDLEVWSAGVNGGYVREPGVAVDATGAGTISLRLKKSTNVYVAYDAPDTSESVTARTRLMVSPRLALAFPGASAARVPAYPAGRTVAPAVTVKGRPECVRLLVERRVGSTWKPLQRSSCEPPRGGYVSMTLPWRGDLRGAALRLSATSAKDRYWAAAQVGPERFTFR